VTIGDDLSQLAVNVRKPRPKHKPGWEPGFEWDGRKGVITSEPSGSPQPPQFTALLGELCEAIGEDAADYEIVGDIQVRRWQQTPGDEYLYYHRATISRRSGAGADDPDVDALLAAVAKRKPRTTREAKTGGAGLVVAIADVQIGKSDGDGVEGTVRRLNDLIGQVEDRWRELRKIGVPLETLYPCFMGDLFEGCAGNYAQQMFRTVLDNREQRKVLRAFVDAALDRWSLLAPRVALKVVGGNHGEEREAGKSFTTFADNKDVAVVEDVCYAHSKNPDRYSNVSFAIPNDDLTLTFDHDGVIIGLAHGHQAGFGSGDPKSKIDRWWRGQMAGQQAIGDADILISGHFHNAFMQTIGRRTHFGCPALEGGSDWYRNISGMDNKPGVLSFVVNGSGWDHMALLDCDGGK
jgi:predicted phosphodiesterase